MKIPAGSSSGRRPRRRFSPAQIQNHLRHFDRSGMSLAAFARQHDLTYSVLLRWVRRRDRAPKPRGHRPLLREMSLGSLLGAGRWAAEIVRPDGVTVRLAHDVPTAWWNGLLAQGAC